MNRHHAGCIIVYIVSSIFLGVVLFPMIWMVAASFTPEIEISSFNIIPQHPSLDSFMRVIYSYSFSTFFFNSLIVAGSSTLLAILLGTLGGYALSRMRAPGTEAIFMILLFTLFIPIHVRMVSLFMIIHRIGLTNTLLALAIPHIASPISIFLSRQYFKTIPRDLDEAALIDGCSWFRIYWSIVLPLSKPMLCALAIFKFLWAWNDFVWPLMVAQSTSKYTLTVGLALLRYQYVTEWGLHMAGAAIASAPMMIIFLAFQRYFVRGIALTGMKG